jgi:hypothetical protein
MHHEYMGYPQACIKNRHQAIEMISLAAMVCHSRDSGDTKRGLDYEALRLGLKTPFN